MKTTSLQRMLVALIVFMAAPAEELHAALPPSDASASVRPTADGKIAKVFVEKPGEDETGSLHIVYRDGFDVVEIVPPKAEPKAEGSQAGFSELAVARDQETVGWGETHWECCQSYPIPLVLTLYRSGNIIRRIRQGQMLWAWSFRDGGRKVATVWGTTHGSDIGDFQLYDVKTGRMLAEVFGAEDTQKFKSDAPNWAQDLQEELDKPARPLERVVVPPADAPGR
ncbi:MAG TPA: hypothetical protein VIH77_00085 [Steroidobacteraceae bacterium]